MNIFDRALEEISCINQDLIQLFDNSCMNISAVTSVKALKLGKLYKEIVDYIVSPNGYEMKQIIWPNERDYIIKIVKRIKVLENE